MIDKSNKERNKIAIQIERAMTLLSLIYQHQADISINIIIYKNKITTYFKLVLLNQSCLSNWITSNNKNRLEGNLCSPIITHRNKSLVSNSH